MKNKAFMFGRLIGNLIAILIIFCVLASLLIWASHLLKNYAEYFFTAFFIILIFIIIRRMVR